MLDDREWCWRLVRPRPGVSRGTPRLKCVLHDNTVVLQMFGARTGARCRVRGRGRVSDARAGRESRSSRARIKTLDRSHALANDPDALSSERELSNASMVSLACARARLVLVLCLFRHGLHVFLPGVKCSTA